MLFRSRIDGTLSWWSLVFMEPRFDSIEIDRPELNVKRNAQGVISVAGIEISGNTDGGGLSDWLLRQEEISIRGAAISWEDEVRGAPTLELKHVDFRLENDLYEHRFGLRAEPPREGHEARDVGDRIILGAAEVGKAFHHVRRAALDLDQRNREIRRQLRGVRALVTGRASLVADTERDESWAVWRGECGHGTGVEPSREQIGRAHV